MYFNCLVIQVRVPHLNSCRVASLLARACLSHRSSSVRRNVGETILTSYSGPLKLMAIIRTIAPDIGQGLACYAAVACSAVPGAMKEVPADSLCNMLSEEVVADLQTSCPVFHGHKYNLKNRFELKKTLGKGTYGKVKLAVEGATGKQVAIKYIKKSKIHDEHDLNRIRREIKIMSSLHHPHIVNVHEVYENRDRIILVMECADGGELYDYINNNKLTEKEARRIFRQIVSAVKFLHQNGIVHRDLKLENLLLDQNNNAKIADFGLSNYYSQNDLLKTYCGSPLYASPEIVNGQPYYGPEVDCWSLGVVLYTLVYGTMPFDGTNFKKLRSQITTGDYYEPAQPSEAAGLIRHLLTVNPAKRATILDIVCHWWVNLGYRFMPDNEPYVPSSVLQPVPTCHNHNQTLSSSSSSESDECEVDGRTKPKTVKPLKGILKKPKIADTKNNTNNNTQCNDTNTKSGEGVVSSVIANENSNPLESQTGAVNVFSKTDGQTCDNLPEVETQSSRKSSEEGLDAVFTGESNNSKTVFDSHKMPKRGILKRKGKFSAGDSGCEMGDVVLSTPPTQPTKAMDLSEGDSALESPDTLITRDTKDSLTCAQTQSGAFIFENGSTTSSSTSSTLPSAESVVVVPRRRGILKNSSKDPDKRLSTCSTGSNSSADILDFSYDSSDESLATDFCPRDSPKMSMDYGSEIRDLRLQGQAALGTEDLINSLSS